MSQEIQMKWSLATRIGLIVIACGLALGCGDPEGRVLRADAEFDPALPANVFHPISESSLLVAQTFVVEEPEGMFEEFELVLTAGESADDGIVRVTVRPLDGSGVPDPTEASSIIVPFDVDTATLPAFGADEFTTFFVGDDPNREVIAGDELAIVVEFINRSTSTDVDPIARLAGVSGDVFVEGTGSEDADGTGFTNSTDDYFFRTFILTDI